MLFRSVESRGATQTLPDVKLVSLNLVRWSIAGRSPSYLLRQLNDIKHGTRKSPYSLTMLPAVAGPAKNSSSRFG